MERSDFSDFGIDPRGLRCLDSSGLPAYRSRAQYRSPGCGSAVRVGGCWRGCLMSAVVTNARGIDPDAVGNWCRQMAALASQEREIVMVSSGAIAEGMKRLGWAVRPKGIH